MVARQSMHTSHTRRSSPPRPVGVFGFPGALGRRGSRIAWPLAALLLAWQILLLTPTVTQAAEIRHGDAVVVAPGETIDDDLYAFGQTVSIRGIVNGDVIAAAQSVSVAGRVNGDLMAAGGTVVVSGPVAGAARIAGQSVEVSAPIGGDLLAAAATLNAGPGASVGRDVLAAGQAVTLAGPVERSIRAGAETLTVDGPVGGDVLVQAGTLRLGSGARVQGSLVYTSSQDAVIERGATVAGPTTRFEAPAATPEPSPASRFWAGALAWLQTLVGLSVFGLLLVLLFPGFGARSTDALSRLPWPSLGLGFAVLVGAPVAALFLFVVGLAVGGWWIGALLLALYLGAIPVGYTVAGLFIGHVVMRRIGRAQAALGWYLPVGLLVFGLVSLVPVLGGLVLFGALLFGLGAGILAVVASYRGQPSVAAASPSPDVQGEQTGEPIAAR